MQVTIDLPKHATGATVEVIKPQLNGKPIYHEGFTKSVMIIKTTYKYDK
jgi:hypothetical protein